jgi:hypothetical protein
VYFPGDSVFLQSLRNNYLLRCSDGILFDAKPTGISKYIYLSVARRDTLGDVKLNDTTWLEHYHSKPNDLRLLRSALNVGQFINHRPEHTNPNVMYFEFDFPHNFATLFR